MRVVARPPEFEFEGQKLVDELLRSDVDLNAAFWWRFSDEDRNGFYKLVLIMPAVKQTGPKSALRKVQSIVRRVSVLLRLSDTMVESPDSDMAAIAQFLGTGGVRVSNTVFVTADGSFTIDDALFYYKRPRTAKKAVESKDPPD